MNVMAGDSTILHLIKIKKVNQLLNRYEYMIVKDGEPIRQIKRADFDGYTLLTPQEFKRYKGGICWDYTMYEAFYFKKEFPSIQFNTIYVAFRCGKGELRTHTFLLFYIGSKCYWFESSWKSHCGIYQFGNMDEAISYVVKELSSKLQDVRYTFVSIYNAMDPGLQKITSNEYMNKLLHGKEYENWRTVDPNVKVIFREKITL